MPFTDESQGEGKTAEEAFNTGVAPFNIGSLTIYYAFWLPGEHGILTRYTKLSAQRLHELRLLCRDINTIIIYEISMVSYEILGFIHQLLTEIKGTDETEVYFGGLSIIAVGQLPPICEICASKRQGICATINTFMEGPIHNGGTPYKYTTEK